MLYKKELTSVEEQKIDEAVRIIKSVMQNDADMGDRILSSGNFLLAQLFCYVDDLLFQGFMNLVRSIQTKSGLEEDFILKKMVELYLRSSKDLSISFPLMIEAEFGVPLKYSSTFGNSTIN